MLTSIRLLTRDVDTLVAFYERLTGRTADRLAPVFAEIRHPGSTTLAVADASTVPAAQAAANRSVLLEFRVEDVDAEFARLDPAEVVQGPTTMPWGNRSALFRDPDDNLVNLFTPLTEQARARS
ncbi:VOC family protein [Kineococcus rhizosphaerae]|uniref:Glyoxalase/bleomycin resistance protein/dioxygenase superfamily protein n=1 Tax=Kineococcus rhizosphaerae TaxID=559628 RepID=A0A2T0R7E7_9ACTN|nr:VOC family protein [Kineococcus rhizosphaerae]PRY17089.1 glyoxalase/bleomycin resistance protein/dioxygenase superfamily protein [Kineococcus rhizosphaerae]